MDEKTTRERAVEVEARAPAGIRKHQQNSRATPWMLTVVNRLSAIPEPTLPALDGAACRLHFTDDDLLNIDEVFSDITIHAECYPKTSAARVNR
jgi:hypothetical protein